jgi:hypothetical protein
MAKLRNAPRQRRSQATYDRALAAAARLFERLGYEKTTTNKVAEAAGISIGTLYHYIADKDALLLSLPIGISPRPPPACVRSWLSSMPTMPTWNRHFAQ